MHIAWVFSEESFWLAQTSPNVSLIRMQHADCTCVYSTSTSRLGKNIGTAKCQAQPTWQHAKEGRAQLGISAHTSHPRTAASFSPKVRKATAPARRVLVPDASRPARRDASHHKRERECYHGSVRSVAPLDPRKLPSQPKRRRRWWVQRQPSRLGKSGRGLGVRRNCDTSVCLLKRAFRF